MATTTSTVTRPCKDRRQVLVMRFTAGERIAHWVHFIAFTILLGTGLFLYMPALRPFAVGEAGEASRLAHRGAAILFMAAPLVYLIWSPRDFFYSLREAFTWGPDDLGWLRAAWGYYTRGDTAQMPPQGKYNAGQKFNALTQIITFILFVVSGMVMWFGRGVVSPAVFVGSVIIHDLSMMATVALFILHIYLVAVHPLMRESITAMFEGTVTEEFAREHHGKWLAEQEQERVYRRCRDE
ncbi:MAG: formate dehydrogenase subunit gamma [Chloroflexaceae bacterium]